ncbi:hypothetical protein [Caldivirga sp. UBA161]|uniref:hypothetical protein n=1 Tax=Caldivirga sp. UBA161 TaxID=1915569 RepID=UPI0025C07B07|nr:hypothetical protein [Caldivirga sp. UBA161]
MKLFRCSLCGAEVPFSEVVYIKGNVVICRRCFPTYYVKNCAFLRRRLIGENPQACSFCQFRKNCDSYIASLKGSSEA